MQSKMERWERGPFVFGHEAICCSRQVIEVVKQKVSLEHPIAKLLKVKILAAVFPKSDGEQDNVASKSRQ